MSQVSAEVLEVCVRLVVVYGFLVAELHEDHDLLLKLDRHFVLLEAHVQLIQAPLELRLVLVDVLDVVRYVAEDHAGEDEAEDHVRGRQPGLRSALGYLEVRERRDLVARRNEHAAVENERVSVEDAALVEVRHQVLVFDVSVGRRKPDHLFYQLLLFDGVNGDLAHLCSFEPQVSQHCDGVPYACFEVKLALTRGTIARTEAR